LAHGSSEHVELSLDRWLVFASRSTGPFGRLQDSRIRMVLEMIEREPMSLALGPDQQFLNDLCDEHARDEF
jgi:hypothetical protein